MMTIIENPAAETTGTPPIKPHIELNSSPSVNPVVMPTKTPDNTLKFIADTILIVIAPKTMKVILRIVPS